MTYKLKQQLQFLPELWEYVQSVITEGLDNGYIQPESAI